MRIAIAVCAGVFISSVVAADTNNNGLLAVKSLKCQLGSGIVTTWKNGVASTSGAAYGTGPFYFDSINLKKGTARLIGTIGASDVRVMRNSMGITFIELAGTLTDATTVFFNSPTADEYLVVDSRHGAIMDTPFAEQYYGTCKVMQ